jgi:predicted transcriptional regulator
MPRPSPRRGQSQAALERDAVIMGLRREGHSQAEIARRLGVGTSMVSQALRRGLSGLQEDAAAQSRGLERLRYDWLEKMLVETIQGRHYMVSNGRVMLDPCDPENMPLMDPKPRTEAAGVLIRLWERRSKLLGLDTPSRTEVQVRHEHEVVADIDRIMAQLASSGAGEAAAAAAAGPVPQRPKALEGPRPAEAAPPG